MFRISRRNILKSSAASFGAFSMPAFVSAQTSSYTANDLKGVLMPLGGLRAGNADGTIPAWTGGYSTVAEGYKQGDPRPVPFADEKSLFTITESNCSQYQDKLPKGAIALFAKRPDYTVQVYPTHRTAIAPQYVYDNTFKNATNAQIAADGVSITGAYGGLPFPIPKNGAEVIWNHLLAWAGVSVYSSSDAYTVTASGQKVFDSRTQQWFQ